MQTPLLRMCAGLLLGVSLPAQTTTWLGTVSTDWGNTANWSGGMLPTATIGAVIAVAPNRPSLAGTGACRTLLVHNGASLALAAGAILDLHGSATTSGSPGVFGPGTLRALGTICTFTGSFSNIDAVRSVRLTAGTGATNLHVASSALIYPDCSLTALALDAGATVTVQPGTAPVLPLRIGGNLDVVAGATLDNQSTVPVTLSTNTFAATQHHIAGTVNGPLAIAANLANISLELTSTLNGTLDVDIAAGRTVTIDGRSQGRVNGALTTSGSTTGILLLDDVTFADAQVWSNHLTVAGTVTAAFLHIQSIQQLSGGEQDVLSVASLLIHGSRITGEPPGFVRIRNDLRISNTSVVTPIRGTITYSEPVDGVSHLYVNGSTSLRIPSVVVTGGAHVVMAGDDTITGGRGPRIGTLTVVDGTVECYGVTIENVIVEPAGRLTVVASRGSSGVTRSTLGPTTVRGTAEFTETVFGDSAQSLASSLTVENGGIATIHNDTTGFAVLDVDSLRITNAQLQLDYRVGLVPTSRLTLDGTPSTPAVIRGDNSVIDLDGAIDARSFRISGMSSSGVRVRASATFGAPPFDFRGGHITGGWPGGVLLELTRSAPTTLYDLDFDDVAGGAARNIRCLSGSPITVVDSVTANRDGENFDDDEPGNRVTWRTNATAITDLAATPGINRNLVSFRTTVEETTALRVLRIPNSPLTAIPATGPRTYSVVDDGLLAGTRYTYRVQRQRLSPFGGEWDYLLGGASATPHAANEGITRFVGPNGYASIAAALSGAPSGSIVYVEAGNYPGFTLSQPLRILGNGGLVRITSPVTISNVVGGDVVFDGLEFQQGALLTLADVSAPVILRDLFLRGQQQDGLRLERCPKVAMQRVDANSRITTVAATVHASSCDLGVVSLTQSSRLVHADTTANSITPDATSTVVAKTGPSAQLNSAPAWPVGSLQALQVNQGGAGHLFGLLLGVTHDYFDLSALVPFDMVLLVSPFTLLVLPGGVLDNTGNAMLSIPGPPNAATVGYAIQLQVYTLDPSTVQGRFAEIRQVLLLR